MSPVARNITIYRGDTYQMITRLRALDEFGEAGDYLDITDCIPTAQVRVDYDAGTTVAEFDCEVSDAENGQCTLTLSAAQTQAMSASGVWDFQLEWPDGTITTYLAGTVTLSKDVTHD